MAAIVTSDDLDPATLSILGGKVVAKDPTKAPNSITYTTGLSTPIVTGDTVDTALSKLQGQISSGAGAGGSSYKTTIGGAAGVLVTHSLNSLDVSVSVYEVATNTDAYPMITRVNPNQVQITFSAAVPAASHRVIVRA